MSKRSRVLIAAIPAILCMAMIFCFSSENADTSANTSCELRDVCIDSAGALLGVLIVSLTLAVIRRKRAR